MHEMGLCDALLKMAQKILQEGGMTQAQRLTVEVGDLSGVVPHYLSDCWQAVAHGTIFEKTEFIIEQVPGSIRCLDCGKVFDSRREQYICPACGSLKLTPISGRDMTLKEIVAC